jgi:hypothetical protein
MIKSVEQTELVMGFVLPTLKGLMQKAQCTDHRYCTLMEPQYAQELLILGM